MKKKENPDSFIERKEEYHKEFEKYHSSKEYEGFWRNMRIKKFNVVDTEVNYRMMHHWGVNDLLPDGVIEGGAWRKFTLVELVWVKAIVRMRNAGISLDKIKLAKESLIKFDKKKESYPLLEFYIAQALSTQNDPCIIVISNGDTYLGSISEVKFDKIFKNHFDVLLLSLGSILTNLGFKVSEDIVSFLSEEEGVTLSELRSVTNKKVEVQLNRGKIFQIESTEVIQNPPSYLDIQKKIKNNRMYGKATFQAEDGETKSLEITKKKRFG
ncbi:MAG: hypothetical protein A2566_02625 [Candidatus Zambryskibacteria bacterium RIFOXYD1_FULL_40_13]|nr:MAG: hypothetical protein UT25_C0002G0158 [Parcubacteria group bacterium GW2011_GWC1_39_12]KKR19342.1 MAG: hypothetical protein UT49_C0002G0188 [Parcubacteria group bacterium GW2011_GWF1_39_37]KKR35275.1 MAG: hypothetical protein UT68_C0004G0083 [Parcubacteria group bacterium GW2011_GWC2_40_10]KKR52292.1 MAG: hypothetical protein UT89_C0002G0093 [Parcubacteria group bacterium GW2011_GWE1_40_20]KKR66262.1 MAG: hypothetical protein UU06_C0003G0012 [Parcubacteria group bacterium GW2011_GWB1_40_